MKIVLLTTDTTHHLYYALELNKNFQLTEIFLEEKRLSFPFETKHDYEEQQTNFEKEHFFSGFLPEWKDISSISNFNDINSDASLEKLKKISPDVLLVFGTGKLLPDTIKIAKQACLNLHGGNPEEYRGLDSHLWAIYHNDYENLTTVLHSIESELDTGEIVEKTRLVPRKGMLLHQFRSLNTEACIKLSTSALASLHENQSIKSIKQNKKGRYYSAMPSVLKDICLEKFERFTKGL